MTFGASGHDGTAFSLETKASVKFHASENWTPTAQGTYFTFITTPNGSTARTERLRIDNAGHVGIGVQNPTAKLHLEAGTASANTAPLKFTSGSVMTAQENGAVEYDGTNYFATSENVRYKLSKTLTATPTLDFPSTNNASSSEVSFALPNAEDGDPVVLGIPDAAIYNGTHFYQAWVSSPGNITVRFTNYTTVAQNPPARAFKISVLKF